VTGWPVVALYYKDMFKEMVLNVYFTVAETQNKKCIKKYA